MNFRRQIILIVTSSFVAWAGCAFYSLNLNPEIRFYCGLSKIQKSWADVLRSKTSSQHILIGGSSALFSVMPERAWNTHSVPLVNLGVAAGMQPQVMILRALDYIQKGDTLILALEPGLLTANEEMGALGVQYAFAMGRSDWICRPALGLRRRSWGSAFLALRPGAYHIVTLAAKIVTQRPLYRYRLKDVSSGGWVSTESREFEDQPPRHREKLAPQSVEILESLARLTSEREINLMYALPWAYCPEDHLKKFRQENASFLLQVQRYMPILFDPRLGAIEKKSLFADTAWHLSDEGSRVRTDELAAQLRRQRMWKCSDLQKYAGKIAAETF